MLLPLVMRRVLRKRLHLKAYNLSIIEHLERYVYGNVQLAVHKETPFMQFVAQHRAVTLVTNPFQRDVSRNLTHSRSVLQQRQLMRSRLMAVTSQCCVLQLLPLRLGHDAEVQSLSMVLLTELNRSRTRVSCGILGFLVRVTSTSSLTCNINDSRAVRTAVVPQPCYNSWPEETTNDIPGPCIAHYTQSVFRLFIHSSHRVHCTYSLF
jgi:hypothetical protein